MPQDAEVRIFKAFGALLALNWLTGCIGAGSVSNVTAAALGSTFPVVTGTNLTGEEVTLPEGFAGRRNLVATDFERDEQTEVDTGIAIADARPGLSFYELPTIEARETLFRLYVNNGIHAGIADEAGRKRTITLYLDKERFGSLLNLPDEDEYLRAPSRRRARELWRAWGPAFRKL